MAVDILAVRIRLFFTSILCVAIAINVQPIHGVHVMPTRTQNRIRGFSTDSPFRLDHKLHSRRVQLERPDPDSRSYSETYILKSFFRPSRSETGMFGGGRVARGFRYKAAAPGASPLQGPSTNSSQDGEALLELKKEIEADPLQQLSSWNFKNLSNVCTWGGITCNKAGRVISLELSGLQLNGTLSESLGNLPFLVDLDLSSNFLSGRIPESLQHCVNLEVLDLSSNSFTGPIPEFRQNMTELGFLRGLNLSRNGLTGEIPSTLASIQSLESLDLSYNFLQGSIPQVIFKIDRLQVMKLSSNNLSGRIPSGSAKTQTLFAKYPRNEDLCGAPSNKNCESPSSTGANGERNSDSSREFLDEWMSLTALGFGWGLGFLSVSFLLLLPESPVARAFLFKHTPFDAAEAAEQVWSYGAYNYK